MIPLDQRPCSVWGEPVDLEVAHNSHAEDCLARRQLRAVRVCDEWFTRAAAGNATARVRLQLASEGL